MKFVMALILIASAYIVDVNGRESENVMCGKSSDAKLVIPCHLDCQHHHGAFTGTCVDVGQGEFHCKCQGRAEYPYEKSLQCTSQTDNFREVCNMDCMCHHGAKGGFCDWDKKACICIGENKSNVGCRYNTIAEFVRFVYEKMGEKALGAHGMSLIAPILKLTETH